MTKTMRALMTRMAGHPSSRLLARALFALVLGASVAASAQVTSNLSPAAALDWQKIRLEQIIAEKAGAALGPLVGKDQYVFNVTVRHRIPTEAELVAKKLAPAPGNRTPSLAFEITEDSVLLGRLGINQDIYNELLKEDVIEEDPKQPSVLEYITGIDAELYVDNAIAPDKLAAAQEIATKVLSGYSRRATPVVAKKTQLQPLPPPPPPVNRTEQMTELVRRIAIPLAAIILFAAGIVLILMIKRIPSTESVHRHKLDLEHAKRRQLALEKKNIAGEAAPPPDTPLDFERNRDLNARMAILCKSVPIEVMAVLAEAWYLEGDLGWKKSIFTAKVWNELRPETPIRIQPRREIVELFRNVAKINYQTRNILLETAIHEIVAAQSLGPDAFQERFGFLLTRPESVQHEAFLELPRTVDRIALLTHVPESAKPGFLAKLSLEEKEELFGGLISLKYLRGADLDATVKTLKVSVRRIEQTSIAPGSIDISHQRVQMIEGLDAKEELAVMGKLHDERPALREWLKMHYFGLSLFEDLKGDVIVRMTKDLDNNRMVDLLLALPASLAERVLSYLPKLKAAVVSDVLAKARDRGLPPDWDFLTKWVKQVRRGLKDQPEFKFRSLYTQVDESLAASVDAGSNIAA